MPMQACMLSRPSIADWKWRPIFSGDQWTVARIKRVPGDYVVKRGDLMPVRTASGGARPV
jgi:hypothetical protein